MHWCREGTKQKSRILYVFRTPGGVRVGREALESDVLKRIEAEHPDIEFDWSAVFHNQQVIETATEPRRLRKRPSAETPAEAAPAPPPPPRDSRSRPPLKAPHPTSRSRFSRGATSRSGKRFRS